MEKRKARNGKPMMVLRFWKAPLELDHLRTKLSYSTIDCFHMLQDTCSCKFEDNWFRDFTTCLDEQSFTAIKKGDTYLCLVRQVEELFEKDGEVITYEKGDRFGNEILLVKPEIIAVYPLGTKAEVNYFDLYKRLRK